MKSLVLDYSLTALDQGDDGRIVLCALRPICEVQEWMDENTVGRYSFRQAKSDKIEHVEKLEVRFWNDMDALLFKMRWSDGVEDA